MNYETAREILAEAVMKSPKAQAKSEDILNRLKKNIEHARDKEADQRARAAVAPTIQKRYKHEDRADHFDDHIMNYHRILKAATKHHKAGDYASVHKVGSYHAYKQPHMKNIP
jgi:uncharacterized membrane protein YccC